MEILIKKVNDEAKMPAYSSEAGAGIDLYSVEDMTIAPQQSVVVGTGVAMAVPVGYVGLVWNKNSLVINESIKVVASMIDSSDREEVRVELLNTGSEEHSISAGDKIAQILVQHIHRAHLIEAEDLSVSDVE